MSARTNHGRHRAARRPIALAPSGVAGRRAAVVATAGGLLVSTFAGASAAQAAPVDSDAAQKLSTVDLGALTDQAREALEAAPVVTVDAKAKVDVEKVTAKIAAGAEITPAPEPEPEPVVEEVVADTSADDESSRTTDTASRSEERTAVEAPASAAGSSIVSIAMRYVGVPYVSGGTSPSGFDCSGLTQYVYAQAGISLPRTSSAQRYAGTVVSASEAQPGDLVWTPGHVAIYAGDGMQIDAPKPGDVVKYRAIWQSNPTFIRVG
ncbi:C40 family peptidase [Krasilnikoviella flava]|uniref:Cell wall-associated hydrolase, NlpC family n=1 Tax=Krasilnikoviella flava TaxID=526729 RepID=A0A1T5IHY7_9MICO|nr:C40 family peptidase [Krasilnikoviella flava]SKC38777.1 Cell wall-associated hydrolase, NlpC family [Krasilnikoviella flava]